MTTMNMGLDVIWDKVKKEIRKSEDFDDLIFNTYFDKTTLTSLIGNKAVISAGDYFTSLIFAADTELNLIRDTLQYVLDVEDLECEVVLGGDEPKNALNVQSKPKQIINDDGLNPDFNYDNFVVGTNNAEVNAASHIAAFRPGQYTPLFIHGNSGLGKTHLLHAIGNKFKSRNAEANVLYIASMDFVRFVVDNLSRGTIEEFKTQMNNLDLLLIDDIQFIAGKDKSHEIFFHIFNELVNNNKQIVITSDRKPEDIKDLEDRLVSRFTSGLTLSVSSPEYETALAILYKKLESNNHESVEFHEDSLGYLAANFASDIRMLEGKLNRLIFYSIQLGETGPISLETTMEAFKEDNIREKDVTPKVIKRVVADYYGLTITQLTGKSRTKAISGARHIAIYLTRKHLDLPYNKIGEEFGRRDHSTIISACDKIEKAIKKDPLMKTAIKELENKFI